MGTVSDNVLYMVSFVHIKKYLFCLLRYKFQNYANRIIKDFDPFQLSSLSKLISMFWMSYVR